MQSNYTVYMHIFPIIYLDNNKTEYNVSNVIFE